MNILKRDGFRFVRDGAVLVLVTLVAIGCATPGYKKAAQARQSIKTTQDLVAATQQQIASVLSALGEFQGVQAADLRPIYQHYTVAVNGLEVQQRLMVQRNQLIQARAAAYFQVWERDLPSYSDDAVRERSVQRRRETMESVARIQGQFAGVDGLLAPLVRQLRDLERFFGNDLTQNGVTAGTEFMNRIRNDAAQVQQQLQSLAGELDRLSGELSPMRGATEVHPAGS